MAKIPKIIEPIAADFELLAGSLVKKGKGGIAVAKYSGNLPIGGVDIDCAVLEDGTRLLSATSVFESFGRSRKGQNKRLEIDGTAVPPFLAAKNLKPFINQEVMGWTAPIEYMDGNSKKVGYRAELLPVMCELYLTARRADALTPNQMKLAEQSEILLSALGKIGIVTLVDEATGYQYDRAHNALRLLLEQYIADGMQDWIKTFPDTFFVELDRLYKNDKTTSRKRPQYYGRFINTYIYKPIENGYVKDELDRLNITDEGKRKARFHQWLTDRGRNILERQIIKVEALMEVCSDIDAFNKTAKKKKAVSIAPYLFDDMNRIID